MNESTTYLIVCSEENVTKLEYAISQVVFFVCLKAWHVHNLLHRTILSFLFPKIGDRGRENGGGDYKIGIGHSPTR